jgi:capsular polysaccharide biosynthesis protein
MGQLTIKEQIDMASGASAIFGSEGAAFANSIFMENGSLIIPFSREPERFLWHQTISSYVEHDFYPVFLDSFGHPLISEEAILQKLMGSSS